MNRLLLILVAAACLTGCATDNFVSYEGPARPASEVAVIYGAATNDHKILKGLDDGIAIIAVDKKLTSVVWGGNFATKVTVLPGRHYFSLRWAHAGVSAQGKIWIDCEAGKTYVIQRKIVGYKVRLWAEEEGTGKVVGGIPGGEPES
ncbi:hypothetical protein ABT364_01080 [Massilia sp. SR12]